MDNKLTASCIHGVLITELRQIPDERGAVLHMLRNDSSDYTHFGESYFSEIFPGAVKAWKRHFRQTQIFTVPVGRIRLVIYDDRRNSPTKNETQVLELGRSDAYLRVLVPPKLWYGFTCISYWPALLANLTDIPHEQEESEVRPFNDPSMPALKLITNTLL